MTIPRVGYRIHQHEGVRDTNGPVARVHAGQLLVEVRACCISPGTELGGVGVRRRNPNAAAPKRPFGYMDEAQWQSFIGWMRDQGLISSLPTPTSVLTEELLPGTIPG